MINVKIYILCLYSKKYIYFFFDMLWQTMLRKKIFSYHFWFEFYVFKTLKVSYSFVCLFDFVQQLYLKIRLKIDLRSLCTSFFPIG